MRYLKYTFLLCGALLFYAADLRAQNPPASPTVRIYFTARDTRNPGSTLSIDDLILLENGVRQQVTALERPKQVAVNLTLLIDVSGTHKSQITSVRKAALLLVNSSLRPGKDTALVATFSDEVKVEQGATSDLQKLQAAIQSFKPWDQDPRDPVAVGNQNTRGPKTAIWDAVWATCDHILPQTDQRARQVIVLFTDGEDNISQKTTQDAVAHAMRSEAAVYAVRIRGQGTVYANRLVEMAQRNAELDGLLAELTKPTGGHVYSVKDEKGIDSAIAQIASQVQSQYMITYSPAKLGSKGQYRKIEIKTASERGIKMDLAHQIGYYVDGP